MRIRYSTWKRDKQIAINSLRFDPSNPRIKGVAGSERQIIEVLADSEDLKGILDHMARYGIAPIERLIVAYDDKSPIVIEGNRRLAVYKMLRDPNKIPKSLENAVRKVINVNGASEIPLKVGCDIAPDSAEANIYSHMKHAEDKLYRPWAKIQQAIVHADIADRMEKGEPTEVELTPSEIKKARCMLELYKLAGELSRRKGSAITQADLRDFPYTAVDRVFLAGKVGEKIGLKATKGGFTITGDPEEFNAFFEATIAKMGKRGTREFNSNEDSLAWIEEYGYKPNGKTVKLHAVLDQDGEDEEEPHTPPAPAKKRAPQVRKTKLFPDKIELDHEAPKMQEVLKEVESLNVQNHPNTCGIMLRVVLELAVDEGLKTRGLKQAFDGWRKKRNDSLSARLDFIKDQKIITDEEALRPSSNFKEDHLDTLNGWVHSNWCQAVGDDARKKAHSLTPLINELLATK